MCATFEMYHDGIILNCYEESALYVSSSIVRIIICLRVVTEKANKSIRDFQ